MGVAGNAVLSGRPPHKAHARTGQMIKYDILIHVVYNKNNNDDNTYLSPNH